MWDCAPVAFLSRCKMMLECIRFVLCVLVFLTATSCDGQFIRTRDFPVQNPVAPPVPFPACRADNIDCLRRGLRTFFYLMDMGHVGMKPVDPTIINSVAVSMPEEQMSVLLRRANVTGARWTRLTDRRFNLEGGKSGTEFATDLHVFGEINMNIADRNEPYVALITMDMQDIETNITYPWSGHQGVDREDYIVIGPERIAVRNTRAPSYYLQSSTQDAVTIDQVLQAKPSILEHLSNEITTALMHTVVDNFRLFASRVPVRYYYKYK